MRFKDEIWSYFIRFRDEERFVNYKKNKYPERIHTFLDDIEEDRFARLYNTFCWLSKYNSPTLQFSEEKVLTKPTNEEILEALKYMENDALGLLEFSKQYKDKEMRSGLSKKAKKELACVEYYRQLIVEDFYKDKELKVLNFSHLENEPDLEIPKIR